MANLVLNKSSGGSANFKLVSYLTKSIVSKKTEYNPDKEGFEFPINEIKVFSSLMNIPLS